VASFFPSEGNEEEDSGHEQSSSLRPLELIEFLFVELLGDEFVNFSFFRAAELRRPPSNWVFALSLLELSGPVGGSMGLLGDQRPRLFLFSRAGGRKLSFISLRKRKRRSPFFFSYPTRAGKRMQQSLHPFSFYAER